MDQEIQTRSEYNGLKFHGTIANAMNAANEDASIWKISFDAANGERIRLVRNSEGKFEYRSLFEEVKKELESQGKTDALELLA